MSSTDVNEESVRSTGRGTPGTMHISNPATRPDTMPAPRSTQMADTTLAARPSTRHWTEVSGGRPMISGTSLTAASGNPNPRSNFFIETDKPLSRQTPFGEVKGKRKATVIEMLEYVKALGIDPIKEGSFLWIAEDAFSAPLPPAWGEHLDEDGRVYYHKAVTNESTWIHPMDQTFREIVNFQRDIITTGGFWHIDEELKRAEDEIREKLKSWMELFDEHGEKFYYNKTTEDSTYDDPRVTYYHDLFYKIKQVAHMKEKHPLLARAQKPEEKEVEDTAAREEEEARLLVLTVIRLQSYARRLAAMKRVKIIKERKQFARGAAQMKGVRLSLVNNMAGSKDIVLSMTTPARRNKSATRIQSFMRGRFTRKWVFPMLEQRRFQYKLMVPIQTQARCWLARRKVVRVRLERKRASALKIQCFYRGYVDRKYAAGLRRERNRLLHMESKTVVIQSGFRMVRDICRVKAMRRKKYTELALLFQFAMRAIMARKKLVARRIELYPPPEPMPMDKAILVLQAGFRGCIARMFVEKKREIKRMIPKFVASEIQKICEKAYEIIATRYNAATKIQSRIRGYLPRKNRILVRKYLSRFEDGNKGAVKLREIQSCIRTYLDQKHLRQWVIDVTNFNAAQKIQKIWRGKQGRFLVERLKQEMLWPMKGWFEYTATGQDGVRCNVRFLPNPDFDNYKYFVNFGSEEDLNLQLDEMELEVAMCVDQYLQDYGLRPDSPNYKLSIQLGDVDPEFESRARLTPSFPQSKGIMEARLTSETFCDTREAWRENDASRPPIADTPPIEHLVSPSRFEGAHNASRITTAEETEHKVTSSSTAEIEENEATGERGREENYDIPDDNPPLENRTTFMSSSGEGEDIQAPDRESLMISPSSGGEEEGMREAQEQRAPEGGDANLPSHQLNIDPSASEDPEYKNDEGMGKTVPRQEEEDTKAKAQEITQEASAGKEEPVDCGQDIGNAAQVAPSSSVKETEAQGGADGEKAPREDDTEITLPEDGANYALKEDAINGVGDRSGLSSDMLDGDVKHSSALEGEAAGGDENNQPVASEAPHDVIPPVEVEEATTFPPNAVDTVSPDGAAQAAAGLKVSASGETTSPDAGHEDAGVPASAVPADVPGGAEPEASVIGNLASEDAPGASAPATETSGADWVSSPVPVDASPAAAEGASAPDAPLVPGEGVPAVAAEAAPSPNDTGNTNTAPEPTDVPVGDSATQQSVEEPNPASESVPSAPHVDAAEGEETAAVTEEAPITEVTETAATGAVQVETAPNASNGPDAPAADESNISEGASLAQVAKGIDGQGADEANAGGPVPEALPFVEAGGSGQDAASNISHVPDMYSRPNAGVDTTASAAKPDDDTGENQEEDRKERRRSDNIGGEDTASRAEEGPQEKRSSHTLPGQEEESIKDVADPNDEVKKPKKHTRGDNVGDNGGEDTTNAPGSKPQKEKLSPSKKEKKSAKEKSGPAGTTHKVMVVPPIASATLDFFATASLKYLDDSMSPTEGGRSMSPPVGPAKAGGGPPGPHDGTGMTMELVVRDELPPVRPPSRQLVTSGDEVEGPPLALCGPISYAGKISNGKFFKKTVLDVNDFTPEERAAMLRDIQRERDEKTRLLKERQKKHAQWKKSQELKEKKRIEGRQEQYDQARNKREEKKMDEVRKWLSKKQTEAKEKAMDEEKILANLQAKKHERKLKEEQWEKERQALKERNIANLHRKKLKLANQIDAVRMREPTPEEVEVGRHVHHHIHYHHKDNEHLELATADRKRLERESEQSVQSSMRQAQIQDCADVENEMQSIEHVAHMHYHMTTPPT